MAYAALLKKQAGVSLLGKNAIVVGGTSGIGEGIAMRLAKANANVTIVGRSKERGAKLVEAMQQSATNPSAKFGFVPCDCFLLSSVQKAAQELTQWSGGRVDLLVLSQGMATLQGRTETAEGIDQKLALHFYSRWGFVHLLLPLLQCSDDPRVLTVLAAGKHPSGYAHWREDPELRQHYGLKNAADGAVMYNDLMCEQMAKQHPKVSFTHAFPGFVATRWGTEMPCIVRGLVRCLQVFGRSKEECGEFMCSALMDDKFKGGWHLMGSNGELASPSKLHSEEAGQFILQHTNQMLSNKFAQTQPNAA